MDGRVKVRGLNDALAAMRAAFPKDPEQQRRLLNTSMSAAAKQTILPSAKRRAMRGDTSGALSESLAIRTKSKSRTISVGKVAGVVITPVRRNVRALALYIQHYYTSEGRNAPSSVLIGGIRHGHLIEFGTKRARAYPYLWPAAQSRASSYRNVFADILKRKVELAVRRRARKKTV